MASSIIHLAVTGELMKKRDFRDPGRLRFGSVLPDAGDSKVSHLRRQLDGTRRMLDFATFREEFGELMLQDDLYLGYYLHLIQDMCFRHLLYDKYHWNPWSPGNVDRLHRDYAIGNGYVIRKYNLRNDISFPAGFEDEPLNRICTFDTAELLRMMSLYFSYVEEGEIFFFTNDMADEYISEAAEVCLGEVDALFHGGKLTDGLESSWDSTKG